MVHFLLLFRTLWVSLNLHLIADDLFRVITCLFFNGLFEFIQRLFTSFDNTFPDASCKPTETLQVAHYYLLQQYFCLSNKAKMIAVQHETPQD